MSLELFFNTIAKMERQYCDWIVELAYRHSKNEPYTITKEVLTYSYDGVVCWLNDWNEGEEDVKVLGALPIEKVMVISFPIDFIKELI